MDAGAAAAADSGGGGGGDAGASPPIAGAAAAAESPSAGVVTTCTVTATEGPLPATPTHAAVNAGGTEGSQATDEDKDEPMDQADTTATDSGMVDAAVGCSVVVGAPPPAVVQADADADACHEAHDTSSRSAPIGVALTADTGDVKKSADDAEDGNEGSEKGPTWSIAALATWRNQQPNATSTCSSGGCSAIDACSGFIESQLMTKNCADILPIHGSDAFHVCTCMKSLDPSWVRPAATFVSVTWTNMAEDDKVEQLHRWMYSPPCGSFELPIESDPMDEEPQPSSESRLICSNALIELLGISSDLWQKALDHEGGGSSETPSSEANVSVDPKTKGGAPRGGKWSPSIRRVLARSRKNGSQGDAEAIDACEQLIQTHLVPYQCKGRGVNRTKCTCMQSLTPADIRSVATYAATTWHCKSVEEKTFHIARLIQSKKAAPGIGRCAFQLPGIDATKMICQNALCALIGITVDMWKKSAQLALTFKTTSDKIVDCVLQCRQEGQSNVSDANIARFLQDYRVGIAKLKREGHCLDVNGNAFQCDCLAVSNLSDDDITGVFSLARERSIERLVQWAADDAVKKRVHCGTSTSVVTRGCPEVTSSQCRFLLPGKYPQEAQIDMYFCPPTLRILFGIAKGRDATRFTQALYGRGPTTFSRTDAHSVSGPSPILKALEKLVGSGGLGAVEACSRYIRSYLMQQSCYDWISSTRTQCICMKSLNPSQICQAATYVTTIWYEKSEEERVAQLALWIQQKERGGLPFSLPPFQLSGSSGDPKRLCRGAFMKLLFVPAFMWRRAEELALATISSEKDSFANVCDKFSGSNAVVSALSTGGTAKISQSSQTPSSSSKAMERPSASTGRTANSPYAYAPEASPPQPITIHPNYHLYPQYVHPVGDCRQYPHYYFPYLPLFAAGQPSQDGTGAPDKSPRRGAQRSAAVDPSRKVPTPSKDDHVTNSSTENRAENQTSPAAPTASNRKKAGAIAKESMSPRQDCTNSRPTIGPATVNMVRRIAQERAMEPPRNSFVAVLTKPMGLTLSEKSDGIKVSAIKAGSAADAASQVSIGDVLLAVNGEDVRNKALSDVGDIIKKCGDTVDVMFSAGGSAKDCIGCEEKERREDLTAPSRRNRGKLPCSVEGCPNFSQSNGPGMCVSHFEESIGKSEQIPADQSSGDEEVEKTYESAAVDVATSSIEIRIDQSTLPAASTSIQQQNAQNSSNVARESRADATFIAKEVVSPLEADGVAKQTARPATNNASRCFTQGITMKPACSSFSVLLRKPMGLTLSQKGSGIRNEIRVSAIKPDGVVDRTGKISIGNVLLAVDGRDVRNAAFRDVLDVIDKSGSTVDMLFSAGGSEQQREVTNAKAPAATNSVAVDSSKDEARAQGDTTATATDNEVASAPAEGSAAFDKSTGWKCPSCEIISPHEKKLCSCKPTRTSDCYALCTIPTCPKVAQGARYNYMCAHHYHNSNISDGWTCPLCQTLNYPSTLKKCRNTECQCRPTRSSGGTSKRGNPLCSIEGCSKFCQSQCRGMCISHFKQTIADKETEDNTAYDSPGDRDCISDSASAAVVTPSPTKGVSNRCCVEGCSKYKQRLNHGMCRTHYVDSQTKANGGRRRSEPRRNPGPNHCGTCDACMVDECGECKHCLDMLRFGGKWKLKKKCLNRSACTVRGSKKPPATARNNKGSELARGSLGKRKSSAPTADTTHTPPTIRVGEKVMKFFTDSFYEGKIKRLPTNGSPLFFVAYEDGDSEEMDEDGFWAAYSDYRVQKEMVQPSEFVPESLVVANDGRLATVRSFRPVCNGIDTEWSYHVHFTGWPASHDKWMLEVDLRKQTPSTLRWAEKVRASLRIKDRHNKKVKTKAASPSSASKLASSRTEARKVATKIPQRQSAVDHSYPLRDASSPGIEKGVSFKKLSQNSEQNRSPRSAKAAGAISKPTSTQRSAKIAKARMAPSRSIGCDVIVQQYPLRSSEPRSRRAAVDAKQKLSTPRKELPKQPKKAVQRKNLSSKPRAGNKKVHTVSDAENYILPSIVVGTSILKYFSEGKDYFEGKITRLPTSGNKFYRIRYQDGDEEDMDPLKLFMTFSDWCVANNEISLTKFNPNQRVYAADCVGVVREAVILSFCPVLKPACMPGEWSWSYHVHFVGWHKRHDEWLDEDRLRKMSASSTKGQFQKEVDAQRASQMEPPTQQTTAGRKRDREAITKANPAPSAKKKYRWRCHRCDLLNDPNQIKCSGCQGWKGGKMPRKKKPVVVDVSESEADDESSAEEEESSDAEEEEEKSESAAEASDDESSDDEGVLNWRQRKRLTCIAEGCSRLRQFGQYGTLCRSHFLEAQEAENARSDHDSDDDANAEADPHVGVEHNIGGEGRDGEKETEGDAGGASVVGTVRPLSIDNASSGSSGNSGSSGSGGGQSSGGGSNLMDMIRMLKDSDDEEDNDDEDLFA